MRAAVRKVQLAAEAFLSKVSITTIELNIPAQELRSGSPQAVLRAAGKFKGDEEAMQQHLEEIYTERKQQREEAARDANPPSSE